MNENQLSFICNISKYKSRRGQQENIYDRLYDQAKISLLISYYELLEEQYKKKIFLIQG